jgi:hypothetical protein
MATAAAAQMPLGYARNRTYGNLVQFCPAARESVARMGDSQPEVCLKEGFWRSRQAFLGGLEAKIVLDPPFGKEGLEGAKNLGI